MRVLDTDVKGKLIGYPVHIVQAMVNYQKAQGNPANVSIFQEKPDANFAEGGFDWKRTVEGVSGWSSIINYRKFSVLKEKDVYIPPIKEAQEIVEPKYKFGDHIKVRTAQTIQEKVVIAYVPEASKPIWFVSVGVFKKLMEGEDINGRVSVMEEPKELVYLTLKDISEGKGVGVDPECIRIVSDTE